MSPREQVLQRAARNRWEVAEHGSGAMTVSKRGHWIAITFAKNGGISKVSSSTAQFTGDDKLGQVLRLMGTLPIG